MSEISEVPFWYFGGETCKVPYLERIMDFMHYFTVE